MQCASCDHPHRSHSRTCQKWVALIGQGTLVDEGMRRAWDAANAARGSAEGIIATRRNDLDEFNLATRRDMDELVRLVDGYKGLSLSGSFSVHVEKAIQLYRDMEQPTGILNLMEKKLELLEEAEEQGHSGRSGQ